MSSSVAMRMATTPYQTLTLVEGLSFSGLVCSSSCFVGFFWWYRVLKQIRIIIIIIIML